MSIIDMGHLPPAAMAAIDRYNAAYPAIDDRAEAQAWEAGKQCEIGTANSKPHTVLASQVLTLLEPSRPTQRTVRPIRLSALR